MVNNHRTSWPDPLPAKWDLMTSASKKARLQEKKKALEARKKRNRWLISGGIGVAVAGLLVYSLTRPEPPELEATEVFADLGGGHLRPDDPIPAYNSSPATSGPHALTPATCGIYTEELPDVVLVHNLEHGTVVVQYQPDLPEEDLASLHTFARSTGTHILVAPRAELPAPIVITGWTRMLKMDTLDLNTLDVFYQRWARIGPELGVACPFGIDQA
jgi:hypothetical protein